MLVAKVNNEPKEVKNDKNCWVVARRDDYTAQLWYYGAYDTEKQAVDIALELDNGVVLERIEE